jgi:hypothetical protein
MGTAVPAILFIGSNATRSAMAYYNARAAVILGFCRIRSVSAFRRRNMNLLRNLTILCFSSLLCLACADQPAAPREPSLTVGFADEATVARAGGPVIDVKAYNRQPLASAELVDPSGRVLATAPGQLEPQLPSGYPFGPSVGFGVFGGSGGHFGTGVGVGFPLGGGTATVPPGEFVRSRAYILVPDIANYRQIWPQSLVRLKFGTAPGEVTVADVPAPAPGGR